MNTNTNNNEQMINDSGISNMFNIALHNDNMQLLNMLNDTVTNEGIRAQSIFELIQQSLND